MERVKQEIRAVLTENLKELIKQAGNVTAFAKSIGVSRDSVNNWLSGKSDIRLNDLVSISQKYDVSVDYLLGLSRHPTLEQDVKEAAEYTGLTTGAVAALHSIRERSKYEPLRLKTASALIASASFRQLLHSLGNVGFAVDHVNEIQKIPPNMGEIASALRDLRIMVFESTEVYKGVLNELYDSNRYFLETAESLVYGKTIKGAAYEQG